MDSIAKVISLSVRPSEAAHLCFEVGGILGQLNTELGAQAVAFDFDAFYVTLKSFGTSLALGDLSRLVFDSFAIHDFAQLSALAALRAESRKVVLNKAIDARQNSFNSKYINIPAIVSRMLDDYSPSVSGSKPNRLKRLSTLSQQQADELQRAYIGDQRTGVVITTESSLDSDLKSEGHSDDAGLSNEISESGAVPGITIFKPPTGGGPWTPSFSGMTADVGLREGTSGQTSDSKAHAHETQLIKNKDYAFRIPFLECQAQNERAQVSLIDEQFTQFMAGQSVANLGFTELSRMLTNELNSIDNDVFQLQVAYLNTILLSPISGTVTGIYKNPGECVQAGEPVIRIENNTQIYLVANVIFRGPISIGSSVKVETTLFDLAGPPTTIWGRAVAVRGMDDDEQWEVIVKCNNLDAGGKPIFPLGYHFDYENTTLHIS